MTGNRNSISDGGVGALLAKAGLESALLNVRINLPSVREGAFKNGDDCRDRRAADEIRRSA